jgi:hypothetical protein
MKSDRSKMAIGIGLIGIGILWAMANLVQIEIRWELLWPMFITIPGILLWLGFLTGHREHNVGVLIPANILLFMGLTFQFNVIADEVLGFDKVWLLTTAMYTTAPVAIGMAIAWVASGNKAYLVPASIMGAISVCILSFTVPIVLFDALAFSRFGNIFWPLLIIAVGVIIIFSPLVSMLFKGLIVDKNKVSEAEVIK